MAKVHILGAAAAVKDADHDYTHFLLVGERSDPVLVDAGSNPLGKIEKLGVDVTRLSDVILTHLHPDHVAGIPNMIPHLWLLGRSAPLRFYGLPHCMDGIQRIMDAYDWRDWRAFFPLVFQHVAEQPAAPVLENDDFIITAWPVNHFVPTIGLRIENKLTGRVLAYTCDTEPTPALLDLCAGADILIHEAAGAPPGHSTAQMAGQTAASVGAKALYLIHYQVRHTDPTALIARAQTAYDGPVALCRDVDTLEF